MATSVVANANLKHKCAWCDRAFPRMYKTINGEVVCKLGPRCRPFRRSDS